MHTKKVKDIKTETNLQPNAISDGLIAKSGLFQATQNWKTNSEHLKNDKLSNIILKLKI